MLPQSSSSPSKLRNWTQSQRQDQSAKCRAQKIWLKATGPKTIEGKKRSSQNARKHGMRSEEIKGFKKLLRMQAQMLKKYKAWERIERIKRRAVLDMLRQGITVEKYKKIYERNERLGQAALQNPRDLSAEALAKAENGGLGFSPPPDPRFSEENVHFLDIKFLERL